MVGLMQLMERTGRLPGQLRQLVVPLLEKASGGFRPIGVFPALYRVWMKLRRRECQAWEVRQDQSFFAMGKGRCTTDPVWRQAVLAEAATSQDQQAAVILWDLVKFYESISHLKLWRAAKATGFPLAVLRLNLFAYRIGRHVALSGMTSKACFPRKGVVAGCGAATTLVKVLYLKAFLAFQGRHPQCSLDVFVDDLQLSQQGELANVAVGLGLAALDLAEVVQQDLGAVISLAKAGVVASGEELKKKLGLMLGGLAGNLEFMGKNLGVDTTSGRHRDWQARASTRTKRLKVLLPRQRRLNRLKKAGAGKVNRVFEAGIKPQATFGHEVFGFSPAELRQITQASSASLPPFGRGRSSTVTQLLHGNKVALKGAGALLRWAKEVWEASNARTKWGLSLSCLVRCSERAGHCKAHAPG